MSEGDNEQLWRLPNIQRGLATSEPVHDRLRGLRDLAIQAGDNTTLSEVTAALIVAAEANGEVISELLHRMRTSTVGEIAIRPELQE